MTRRRAGPEGIYSAEAAGTRGALATISDSESTSVLSAVEGSRSHDGGIGLQLKYRLRLIALECRRIWEIVSL